MPYYSMITGALGVVEAGFITSHSPFTIEIHGQNGSLLYGTPDDKLLLKTSQLDDVAAQQWTELMLPEKRISAFEQWVEHIQQNTTADENIALAIELTKLMEAANLSADLHKPVALSELKQ